jgi:hypothetical protein
MLMKRRLPLLIALLVILACYTSYEIFIRPFGYATLVYAGNVQEFNGTPEHIKATFGIGRDSTPVESPWTDKLKSLPLHERIIEAVVIARRLDAQGSAEGEPRAANELFQASPRFQRICSETAKIFVALMESAGTSARVVWMCRHTAAEVFDPSSGWILVDPHGNVMVRRNGKHLSVTELIGQTEFEVLPITNSDGQDYARSGYLKQADSVYLGNDCIVALDPDDVFEFQSRLRDPVALLRSLVGEASVARGLQFTGGARAKLGNFGLGLYKRF